jgi:hypothetical protein
MIGDGYLKGLLLALGIALATLIKPFLLVLLPASLLYLWLRPGEFRARTLASLLIGFALMGALVVYPLSSNREYYPSSINDIFLQSGLLAKIQYGVKNFAKNLQKTGALGWRSGELAILGLGLLYVLSPLALTLRRKNPEWSALHCSIALAFLTSLLAVFFLYEYPAWRGSRAIYSFFPVLGLLGALSISALRHWAAVAALALGLCAANAYYAKNSFAILEKSKLRQTSILNQYSSRSDRNLQRLGLRPKILLSTNNLHIAVTRYPAIVILSEPRSLADFSKIAALLPPDVLELNPRGRLFQENSRLRGEEQFGDSYQLAGKGDGFYYYRRR